MAAGLSSRLKRRPKTKLSCCDDDGDDEGQEQAPGGQVRGRATWNEWVR